MEFIRTISAEFEVGQETRLYIESKSGAINVRGDGGTRDPRRSRSPRWLTCIPRARLTAVRVATMLAP